MIKENLEAIASRYLWCAIGNGSSELPIAANYHQSHVYVTDQFLAIDIHWRY
jgi:hypothetical protein